MNDFCVVTITFVALPNYADSAVDCIKPTETLHRQPFYRVDLKRLKKTQHCLTVCYAVGEPNAQSILNRGI